MKKILVLILVFNKDNIFYKEFNVLDKQKLYLNELPDQTKDFNLNNFWSIIVLFKAFKNHIEVNIK